MGSAGRKLTRGARKVFGEVEDIVDENFNLRILPEAPKPADVPQAPQAGETPEERLRRAQLRAIIRGSVLPGRGRSATIATSPAGITTARRA